jgi:hypothetical protein
MGRELALADNRTAEVGLDWDADVISALIEDGVEVSEYFLDDELEKLIGEDDKQDDGDRGEENLVTCPDCGSMFSL